MTIITHITTHLGGGVGKAISGLVIESKKMYPEDTHIVACLEKNNKLDYEILLKTHGICILLISDREELIDLIRSSDIIQIEFWNHPILLKTLCSDQLPSMRLLVWSHISGLFFPKIPTGLMKVANKFVFTSPCSIKSNDILQLINNNEISYGVTSSGGGLEILNKHSNILDRKKISFGYAGSMNFSKLHPKIVDYLASIKLESFEVKFYGDDLNKEILIKQCCDKSKPNLIKFEGYCSNIQEAFSSIDIFIYLLNPTHYGTAENVLLEAMAMGLVPIVLANPAECSIIENGKTGFVINDISTFENTINILMNNKNMIYEISKNAKKDVSEKYSYIITSNQFKHHYNSIMTAQKRIINFKSIFGSNPSEWFLAFKMSDEELNKLSMENRANYNHHLTEKTKGSIYHYLHYFKNDFTLLQLAEEYSYLTA